MSTIKIKPNIYSYSIGGVKVKPIADDGKEVSILYNGPLAKPGSGQVFLHCGFGKINEWDGVNDYPMEPGDDGWEKTLKIDTGNNLNFCFKDGSDNWDNNNGDNWAYRISC